MESARIDDVQPRINLAEDESVPICDQDYWNDVIDEENPSQCSLAVPKTQKIIPSPFTKRTDKHSMPVNEKGSCGKGKGGLTERVNKTVSLIPSKKPTLPKVESGNKAIKQGYLNKKTDGFFFKWTQRYFVLTPEKLIWYQSHQKAKPIGCVNLKLLKINLKLQQKELILDFEGECQNIILKGETSKQTSQWRDTLQTVLHFQTNQQKLMLKTMSKFTYLHQDIIPQRDFLKTVQTGDILLFYTNHLGAKLQRFVTNSDFDHVAMIIRGKNGDPMVFQSNQMHGVAVYNWNQYINYFDLYNKVALRRLNFMRKAEIQSKLIQFAKHNIGQKYELSASKLLTFESDFAWETVKEERGYFCSELVGKALKSVGLLDEKKSSGRYWPVDFAEVSGLQLLRGAVLGPQQTILLSKHTKNNLK